MSSLGGPVPVPASAAAVDQQPTYQNQASAAAGFPPPLLRSTTAPGLGLGNGGGPVRGGTGQPAFAHSNSAQNLRPNFVPNGRVSASALDQEQAFYQNVTSAGPQGRFVPPQHLLPSPGGTPREVAGAGAAPGQNPADLYHASPRISGTPGGPGGKIERFLKRGLFSNTGNTNGIVPI